MEASQLLAIESFSSSWLANPTSFFDGFGSSRISFDNSDQIQVFGRVISPNSLEEARSFNFDIPSPKSSLALVHADEIFCDGQILPLYGDENSVLEEPKPTPALFHKINRSWRKTSKRLLQKCFWFFRPLCRKVVFLRRSVKVDDIDRKLRAVKSWNNTPIMSPQRNRVRYCSSNDKDLRKVKSCNNSPQTSPGPTCSSYDCSVDNSIYEAIVYCKRTIEK